MKRNLLIALALFATVCLTSNAAVTLEQTTEPEYMINSGYSEAFAEEVLIMKNRVAGEPCEPLYEKKHNKLVHWMINLYNYLDPVSDSEERYHHDIKLVPSYTDL